MADLTLKGFPHLIQAILSLYVETNIMVEEMLKK